MSTSRADVEKAERSVDLWISHVKKSISPEGDGQPKEKTIVNRMKGLTLMLCGLEDRWSNYEEMFNAFARLVKSDDEKQKLDEEFDARMDKYLSTREAAEDVLDTIRAAVTKPTGGLNIDLIKKKIKKEASRNETVTCDPVYSASEQTNDDELETEMEYWTAEETAIEAVMGHDQVQLLFATPSSCSPDPCPE